MASATKRPDKVIGMHFFNPVPLMRCIEVIYGAKSSDDSINSAIKFCEKLPCLKGKRYIAKVLKDRPGFIVNRVTAPVQIYQNYVFDLAAEKGATWEQLDNDAGGPMPTCVLADFVGIDTLYHVQNYYAKTLSPDFAPGKTITKMVNEKRFGAKTGKGFYDWSKGRPAPSKEAGKAKIYNLKYPIAIMVNEACRVLEEGITKSWKVIDDAVMAGMNTPGPLAPNTKTSAKQVEVLNELVKMTGKKYFTPCNLLKSEKWVQMV
jgi:enoyl-CoA hydratase/3-hydroxyacyl-CoA dehydrogenase